MSEQRPVALGILPPGELQGQGQAQNPLGMFNQLTEMQVRMQQLQMGNLQIQAKQRFGEIMGTGQGSIEDKFQQALTDPVASAWAIQNYGEVKQGMLALAQTHEIQQKMNISGLNSAGQAVAAVAANPYMTPQQFDQYAASRIAMLGPEARAGVMLPMASIRSQMFDGLENLPPEQRPQELQRRAASILPSLGMSPDDAFALGGVIKPEIQYPVDPVTGIARPTMVGGFGPPALGNVATQPGTPGTTAPPPGIPGPPPAGGGPLPAPDQAPPTGPLGGIGAAARAGVTAGGGIGPPPGTEPVDATMLQSTLEPPGQATPANVNVRPVQGLPPKAPPEQADFQAQLNKGSEGLARAVNTLNIVQDQLEKFTPGRGTEWRNNLASAFERVTTTAGMNADTAKSWGEKIRGGTDEEAQDIYMAQLGGYAMTQLKEAISGTGRAMLPEVSYYMEHLSAETNPRAVWSILNNARTMIQRQVDAQQKWTPFLQALYYNRGPFAGQVPQMSPLNYNIWYGQRNFKNEDLPTQVYGMDMAPRDISRMYHPPATQAPTGPAIRFAPPPQ